MKKYVFITQSISGITGNQRYVNNKCKLLREDGWEVVVLWNYNIAPVQLEHIRCFDNEKYIHHELKFYPSWYTKKQRNIIIDRLANVVGEAEQIVIESNKLELGAWGELLAQKLNCKHINFVTSEGISINNKSTFDFCYSKLLRNEFFTITESAVKHLFSNYAAIEHPENYFWSATQGVDVEEYPFPEFDEQPLSDYIITSFGRRKEFFPYMLSELNLFISRHQNKTFNLFFLGEINNDVEIRNSLALPNVHLSIYPKEVTVIPSQVFSKSDIVIATAGCAYLSAIHGAKTISMDVNRNVPLGLYMYTTLESNTYSGKYKNDKSLSEWLQALLIEKVEYKRIEDIIRHDYDYQMRFIDQHDNKYIDSTNVNELITRHDRFYSFLVKIGLFRVVEFFYFKRRDVKIIRR